MRLFWLVRVYVTHGLNRVICGMPVTVFLVDPVCGNGAGPSARAGSDAAARW